MMKDQARSTFKGIGLLLFDIFSLYQVHLSFIIKEPGKIVIIEGKDGNEQFFYLKNSHCIYKVQSFSCFTFYLAQLTICPIRNIEIFRQRSKNI
jgi:hypothetical protein